MRRPSRTAAATAALLLLVAVAAVRPPAAPGQDTYDVPYVPTPDRVVTQMLNLLRPSRDDTLYDLGSGDGRIVIAAAERFGVPGVGVEIDSGRVALARENARSAGVDSLVRFIRGDLFDADLSGATAVTLYLLPSVNERLRPKLYRELRPGTPVVSHDFDMGDWEPDSTVNVPGDGSDVFFWIIPANAAGTWEVEAAGRTFRMEVDQRYQRLNARVVGDSLPTAPSVEAVSLRGAAITLELSASPGSPLDGRVLTGTVEGDRMSGTDGDGRDWSARRVAPGDPIAGS